MKMLEVKTRLHWRWNKERGETVRRETGEGGVNRKDGWAVRVNSGEDTNKV